MQYISNYKWKHVISDDKLDGNQFSNQQGTTNDNLHSRLNPI
jgi:hypothetical protein